MVRLEDKQNQGSITMVVGLEIKALKAALKAATTKEEEFDIKKLIKELKLESKPSDRQPGIEKANNRKTSKGETPATRYATEPPKKPENLPVIKDGTEKKSKPRLLEYEANPMRLKKGGLAKRGYGKARR